MCRSPQMPLHGYTLDTGSAVLSVPRYGAYEFFCDCNPTPVSTSSPIHVHTHSILCILQRRMPYAVLSVVLGETRDILPTGAIACSVCVIPLNKSTALSITDVSHRISPPQKRIVSRHDATGMHTLYSHYTLPLAIAFANCGAVHYTLGE